nr:MAG: coat protein [Guangxi phenui-like virus]
MSARVPRGGAVRGGRGGGIGGVRGRGGTPLSPTNPRASGAGGKSETTGATVLTEKTEFKVVMAAKEIQKRLREVTDDEIASVVLKTEALAQTDIDSSLFIIFEFQGMDPFMIICKFVLLAKYHKYKDTPTEEDKQELTDSDYEKLRDDIMFCIAANIYMGNLSGKSLSRRSQEGRDKIAELSTKYMIEYGSTGNSLTSDTITFPRTAASFPVLATRMANLLPSKDFPDGEFLSSGIPKPMRISAFASFLSSGIAARTRDFLKLAVAAYSCDQSMTFVKSLDARDAFRSQWTFVEAASNSPVPEREMQQAMLLEFSVVDLFDILHPIVTNLQTKTGDSRPLPTKTQYQEDLNAFIVVKGKDVAT